MQIVIDIDENVFTRLFDNGDEYVADMRRACVAIRKGIPLPKGHGRLIDGDELESRMKIGYNIVKAAETIIEADEAEGEDEE